MIKVSFIFILALMLSMSLVIAADETTTDTTTETNSETSEESTTETTTETTEETTTETTTETSTETTEETTTETSTDVDEEFADEEFDRSAGITPDSPLYFLEDAIFTRFRGDLENREKKIAEIKQMIEEEKYDEARKALARYKRFADKLEEEVDPEHEEEARRTAAKIRKVLRELREQIPEEDRKEFIDDIVDQEGRIATAAEIAATIKNLCEKLAKVDPSQYARTCKTDDDAPKWKKDLDKRLTKDQKEEAEKFFRVMSQCFEDASQCQCDEISVDAFAEKCSIIAPLAAECDAGNEDACDEMDAIEDEEPIEDLLPPHLQEVLREMEKYNDARHENHIPRECEEAGVTDRKGCMRIMFEIHAPQECVDALERGDIDPTNERESREQCEEIMFQENAPQECIDAGLKDHRECGRFMFEQNAPEECIEAGLTGESPRDHRECDKIMDQFRDDHGPRDGPGRGFAFGANCAQIENKDEKLECFENAFSDAENRGPRDFDNRGPGNFDDPNFQPRDRFDNHRGEFNPEEDEKFKRQCNNEGGFWECSSRSGCRCEFREGQDSRPRDDFRHDDFQDDFKDDHQDDFKDDFQDDFNNDFPGEGGDDFNQGSESGTSGEDSGSDSGSDSSGSDSDNSNSGGDSGSDSSSSDSGSDSSGSDSGSSGDSGSDSGGDSGSSITGEVVKDNDFLDYYYR